MLLLSRTKQAARAMRAHGHGLQSPTPFFSAYAFAWRRCQQAEEGARDEGERMRVEGVNESAGEGLPRPFARRAGASGRSDVM